jgi:hypothetical protein
MSGFDIFAWIVLCILLACIIGVFCIAGWLPSVFGAQTRILDGSYRLPSVKKMRDIDLMVLAEGQSHEQSAYRNRRIVVGAIALIDVGGGAGRLRTGSL